MVAACLFAQTKPKDVAGWDKVRWGTTISAVRSGYGVAAQPERKDGWLLLQLPPVKLVGIPMGVQVGAPESSGKIGYVRLWLYFGVPGSASEAGPQDFDAVRKALTQQYGNPDHESSTRGENFRLLKQVRWNFPSTSITLSSEESSSIPGIGDIFIEYAPSGG